MSAGPKIVTAEAEHLLRIARDVRAAGDVPLVRLSIEGVSDTAMTLADELEFIALALDYEAVMALSNQLGPLG